MKFVATILESVWTLISDQIRSDQINGSHSIMVTKEKQFTVLYVYICEAKNKSTESENVLAEIQLKNDSVKE